MNYYTQPEDELILNVLLEPEDYVDLREYLKIQPMFIEVDERGIALDHAFDPHRVIEVVRQAHLEVRVAHEAMSLGGDAMKVAAGAVIKNWLDKRNERKKAEIAAKQAEPLLFDQYGHRIDLRPESKRRKK